jgi:FK506-binding nuclear protein
LAFVNRSESEPKGAKRRRESDEAPQLVDTSKNGAPNNDTTDTSGLSKSQKKKLKKQKLNSGEAAPVNGNEKKVQFAPNLEQGPTGGTTTDPKAIKSALSPSQKGDKKTFALEHGVIVDEHKTGSGPKAKSGTKLGIRYIGKLAKNGVIFDKNTKGAPFRFTLGKGEVIKGYTIRKAI